MVGKTKKVKITVYLAAYAEGYADIDLLPFKNEYDFVYMRGLNAAKKRKVNKVIRNERID